MLSLGDSLDVDCLLGESTFGGNPTMYVPSDAEDDVDEDCCGFVFNRGNILFIICIL